MLQRPLFVLLCAALSVSVWLFHTPTTYAQPNPKPVVGLAPSTAAPLDLDTLPAIPDPDELATVYEDLSFAETRQERLELQKERARIQRLQRQALYVVTDSPYEMWSEQGTLIHTVVYDASFRPVSGANVYLNTKPIGRTNAQGVLVVRHAARAPDGSVSAAQGSLTLHATKATGPTKRVQAWGSVRFEVYARTPSFQQHRLYVYTDRAVYEPGDPLRLRALAWTLRGDFTPLRNHNVAVSLTRDDGTPILGANLRTDTFGVVSYDQNLPKGLPDGLYTLNIQYKKQSESVPIRIQKFDPPDIDIQHTIPRFLPHITKTWDVDVRLSALARPVPKQGTMTLRITAGTHNTPIFSEEHAFQRAKASHTFTLTHDHLNALRKHTPAETWFRATLTIRSASPGSKTDTITRDIRLTRLPWRGTLESDKETYEVGEEVRVQAKVTDIDGSPARGKTVLFSIGAENDDGDRRSRTMRATTNSEGIALARWKARSAGYFDIQAKLPDMEGDLGWVSFEVMQRRPMSSNTPSTVVRERDSVPITVNIGAGCTPKERVVHGDIVDSSGAIVSAFMLPIRKQGARYVASGSFQSPSWGTMLLTLFTVARCVRGPYGEGPSTGLLTEGQQITVTPQRALKITLDGLPKQAKPGDTITVKAKVRSSTSRTPNALLGVSVTDARVLSMRDPLEVTPEDRFYNPELKVLASTGSKMLTWPVVARNWGDERYDIALPPFGFMPGHVEQRRLPRINAMGAGMGVKGNMGIAASGGAGGLMGKSAGSGAGSIAAAPSPPPAEPKPASRSTKPSAKQRGPRRTPSTSPHPAIRIRTKFPATSFWDPAVRAQKGSAHITLKLSDALTNQVITVVASDEFGGVGMQRATIRVKQPISIHTDLPKTLFQGEETVASVLLQNHTARPMKGSLHWVGDARLVVKDDEPNRTVTIPAHGELRVPVRVQAKMAGRGEYGVSFGSGRQKEAVKRSVYIRPLGDLVVEQSASRATSKTNAKVQLYQPQGAITTAQVILPHVASLAPLMRSIQHTHTALLDAPGSRAVTAYHLLRALQKHEALTPERRNQLLHTIRNDISWLNAMRNPNGGYNFVRTQTFSPYLTGRALEGLISAQRAGVPVSQTRIARDASVLLQSFSKEGLCSIHDIAWWEGKSQDRTIALSMELFRILAEAGPNAIPKPQRPKLDTIAKRAQNVATTSTDALAVAHAGLGLVAYHAHFKQRPLPNDQRAQLLRTLQTLRRSQVWQPSWFNADDGLIATTAAALELARKLDHPSATTLLHEASHVLLSHQNTLGQWHYQSANAAIARALSSFPKSTPLAQPETLTVSINGTPIISQTIQPNDPFASALPLASIDLTRHTCTQPCTVEVSSSSQHIQPWLFTSTQQYRPREVGKIGSSLSQIQRKIQQSKIRTGDSFHLVYTAGGDLKERDAEAFATLSQIREHIPSGFSVDTKHLDQLAQRGLILGYTFNAERILIVSLPARPSSTPQTKQIKLRFTAERAGSYTWSQGFVSVRSQIEGRTPIYAPDFPIQIQER